MKQHNRRAELSRKPCTPYGTWLLITCSAEVSVALLRSQLEITESTVMRDAAREVVAC